MTGFAWHQSSTKGSLPTLPLLVIGLLMACVAIPNALHGKLPCGGPFGGSLSAEASMLGSVPQATARASYRAAALLNDDSDSMDDELTDNRFDPISDPSVMKADPAADPMQGA